MTGQTPTPESLPTRDPGATYPGSSTYRQPAATTLNPNPQPAEEQK